jgi:hypothetical protein
MNHIIGACQFHQPCSYHVGSFTSYLFICLFCNKCGKTALQRWGTNKNKNKIQPRHRGPLFRADRNTDFLFITTHGWVLLLLQWTTEILVIFSYIRYGSTHFLRACITHEENTPTNLISVKHSSLSEAKRSSNCLCIPGVPPTLHISCKVYLYRGCDDQQFPE